MPPTTIPNTSGSTLFYQNYFTTTEPSIAQNVSSSIENEDFDDELDISSGSSSYNDVHQKAVHRWSYQVVRRSLTSATELYLVCYDSKSNNPVHSRFTHLVMWSLMIPEFVCVLTAFYFIIFKKAVLPKLSVFIHHCVMEIFSSVGLSFYTFFAAPFLPLGLGSNVFGCFWSVLHKPVLGSRIKLSMSWLRCFRCLRRLLSAFSRVQSNIVNLSI